MPQITEEFDVVVIGAGHAGCEAALACARLGLDTIVFTISMDSVAWMACNPNIGGTSKGHLVREIDALGGEMGKNIDKTFIQSKMLNKSKGPAVHSLRAQADKSEYSRSMRKILENTDHLTIKQAEVSELIIEKGILKGVKTVSGAVYHCKGAVLCTGVYLNARCIYGDVSEYTGPNGLKAANHLTDSLIENGVEMYRFKTGTPARVDKRSIDFSKMEEQFGDERVVPFSFSTDPEDVQIEQVSCWLTYTNEKTHEIIRQNLDRSPLYSGMIHGTGPRYCPSVEDKVVKFKDKSRHQVFLEPEGLYTNEMYVGGMSSSMPEDVQYEMYHTVAGLEHARIVRNAYAIEYDCINPMQLQATLEFKNIKNLFSGGQFNGSSGYEEAAAQGLIAGINAAMKIKGRELLVLDRSESYIGVLIDDLVTKETHEPYRMMTSRAEYRLLLRQDNADLRLRKYGYRVGLINEEQYQNLLYKERQIEKEINRMENTFVGDSKSVQDLMKRMNSTALNSGSSLAELIRRPELTYQDLSEIDVNRPRLSEDVKEQVNINIKYEGYIKRQMKQVEQFKKMENKKIPNDIDYDRIGSLRIEAKQKLKDFRPMNIGQASRISGVSPADVSVLLVYLEQLRVTF
ncbi:tRNA uridine-5-carboxymethylaminomethyl(34) synthesis enzyme MnmG [Novisyntrophococcus fermenticellae]|uniref:tRNA uridine-5-carboxymethylaminomethyl(34) synthesis enzyme MnmG n=1 Tax=Novisyntrophococcus fermenticellae TaxID=2068655 RepID=UPI001E3ECA77|nr:tRNA uridine-5-carboxymethylaminomethyl(34) synthesis enzyme MnmG [Novisyntrophococcus fermenticellae]